MVVWEYLHRWHTSVTISRRVIIVVGLRNLCHKMQFYRTSLLCLFSNWAKLISISLFLLELVSFEFLSFSVSSVSTARETTRSVHFPIIIIRRWLLLADRNCYGPIFGSQSSLSGSGYFCLLWAHLRPFQQRAGALQSPCFHITGSQSCWLKKDPFSNNFVEGEKDPFPLSLYAKNFPVSILSLPPESKLQHWAELRSPKL